MSKVRIIQTPTFLLIPFLSALSLYAQQPPAWEVEALNPPQGQVECDLTTGVATGTNGVLVKYGEAVLTADSATINQQSGEAVADGHVRIQRDEQVWVGEHVLYNFKTRQMEATWFRTGRTPVFTEGQNLQGDITNRVYSAKDGYVTTDDVSEPAFKVRASRIKIVPGQYVEAHNAVLVVDGVPAFYFPYYRRNLGERANNFTLTPGYRSRYGPFVLGSYAWYLNDQLDGILHLDYRIKRGIGTGPDANLHLGQWGEASFKYYYLHDESPNTDANGFTLPNNRQRFAFAYNATPFTNLSVKSVVQYQSDPRLLADFMEGEYRQNPQPKTYFEANKLWPNFSLDTYVQPRVNEFLETVERLPDVKLTAFRQQIGATPVFYESEISAGYYRHLFAEITNSFPWTNNFYAPRVDTYHQLTLPHTFFGWLNVTPRVGGRFTYYGKATGPAGTNDEAYRGVFNTGVEVSFKASRLWAGVTNGWLALDGVRHIFEPSVNYVYVPKPNKRPQDLPQFDSKLPSLLLLPIDFPDYNAIDSIDSQNVLRLGMRNRLQTKRGGQVEDFLSWEIFTDWRLRPRDDQTTFSDIYSDVVFKPRSWIRFESQTRFDLSPAEWRMALNSLTLQPNNRWSWGIGYWYLRNDVNTNSPTALGSGNNLITSTIFYRLNENWGFRVAHYFEAQTGNMQEQSYSIYRDFRSWTGALSFRALDNGTGPKDYTVAFTFSLKASPRFGLGADTAQSNQLLGN